MRIEVRPPPELQADGWAKYRATMRKVVGFWLGCVAVSALGSGTVWLLGDYGGRGLGKLVLILIPAVFLAVTGPNWIAMYWFFGRMELTKDLAKGGQG